MTLEELELALTKLRDAATPEGRAADRAALRKLLEQVPPAEAARIWPRFRALGPDDPEARWAWAGLRSEDLYPPPDPDTQLMALREHLHEIAAPIRQFLRETVPQVRGRDWLEQDWDNYSYNLHRQREWQVIVPFECLRLAGDATVPLAAGRRILGLPAGAEERAPAKAGFLPYWQYHKRFLGLCAEIGGKFFDGGGRPLIIEVLRRSQRLSQGDQTALLLRCAALGLTTDEPLPLARRLLQHAAQDEFGARGGWVLDCVDNAGLLPMERGQDLLHAASALARRTTALVASNPFAACLEALSEVHSPASLSALAELLERAAYIRRFGWDGWQRALRTGAAALQRLVAAGGSEALAAALEHLERVRGRWPAVEAEMLLAGARGLLERGDPAGEEVIAQALAATEALPRLEERGPLLIALGELQAQRGEKAGITQIRQVLEEAHAASWLRRWGTSRTDLLAQGVVALAEVSGAQGGEGMAEALDRARTLPGARTRWIALNACAEVLWQAGEGQVTEILAELRRTGRRMVGKPPPFPVLLPFIDRLAEAGEPLANAMLPLALRMAREGALGHLWGTPFAEAFMGLAAHATEVEQVAAVIDVAWEQRAGWWALPLLALAGDALSVVEGRLLERIQED